MNISPSNQGNYTNNLPSTSSYPGRSYENSYRENGIEDNTAQITNTSSNLITEVIDHEKLPHEAVDYLKNVEIYSPIFRDTLNTLKKEFGVITFNFSNPNQRPFSYVELGEISFSSNYFTNKPIGSCVGAIIFELVNLGRCEELKRVARQATQGDFRKIAIMTLAKHCKRRRFTEDDLRNEEKWSYAEAFERAEVPSIRKHYDIYKEVEKNLSEIPLNQTGLSENQINMLMEGHGYKKLFEDSKLTDQEIVEQLLNLPHGEKYAEHYDQCFYHQAKREVPFPKPCCIILLPMELMQ